VSTSVVIRQSADPQREELHPSGLAGLEELMAARRRETEELLNLPWWKPTGWFRRPWDSEARKSLARIRASIDVLYGVEDRLGGHERELQRLLEPTLVHCSLDNLIELVYALDELLVTVGHDELVGRRAIAEALPDHPEVAWTHLDTAFGSDAEKQVAIETLRKRLLVLYEMRRFRYRRERARRRMKSFNLMLAALVLLALALLLAWGIDDAIGDPTPGTVFLTAVAGALGGTLANLLRLRDELSRGTEFRAFKPMLLAQPAVGAVSGLVVLLVVDSGFLGLGDGDGDVRWETLTLLAFAAGFSEAFFLGIVRKVAAAADAGEGERHEVARAGGSREST
jgi:hypothetical protein